VKRLAFLLIATLAVLLSGCGAPATELPTFDDPTSDAPVEMPVPQLVEIPALGVSSTLMDLHLDPVTKELQAPPIEGDPMQAGWFADGVRPGEVGPAIIAAHVNAHGTPGLFKNLHTLAPGEPVYVDDLTFIVDKVEQYDKDEFPTTKVYGNTDGPELRLITCGGDVEDHHYTDNIVVYASISP